MKKYQEQIIAKTQNVKYAPKGYVEFNGKYYFMDAHRIFGCGETLEYEPMNPQFKIEHIIENIEDCTFKIDLEGVEIDTKKKAFVIGTPQGKVAINPKYLKDMIRFTKSNVIYINPESFNHNSYIGIIVTSGKNDNLAICLPINNVTETVVDVEVIDD